MLWNFRAWLIRLIVGKHPVAANWIMKGPGEFQYDPEAIYGSMIWNNKMANSQSDGRHGISISVLDQQSRNFIEGNVIT